MNLDTTNTAELNGEPVDPSAWRALALLNYGHFTAFQICDGAVRGLDLHLDRLAAATQELFGVALDQERTRAWIRRLSPPEAGALSMRVTVYSRAFQRDRPGSSAPVDVLVSTSAARQIGGDPVSVTSMVYARDTPHIKHIGTFGLFHRKRLAQLAGFDDAVFVDANGVISEGSIWNIGFLDDDGVVWPEAPMLRGVSMQLLQQGLEARSIPARTRSIRLDELARFRGAFFTNSACAVLPIRRIDAVDFIVEPDRIALLQACHATIPALRV